MAKINVLNHSEMIASLKNAKTRYKDKTSGATFTVDGAPSAETMLGIMERIGRAISDSVKVKGGKIAGVAGEGGVSGSLSGGKALARIATNEQMEEGDYAALCAKINPPAPVDPAPIVAPSANGHNRVLDALASK